VIERRVSEAPVLVERRKRGRPPLSRHNRSTEVHLKLPADLYDRIYAIARRRGLTIQEVIRRRVVRSLRRNRTNLET
jgi:hypothetical protein